MSRVCDIELYWLLYFGPCGMPRCFCNMPIAAKVCWASACQAADVRILSLLVRAGAIDLGFLLRACHTVVVKISGAWPISRRANIGIMERWSGTRAAFLTLPGEVAFGLLIVLFVFITASAFLLCVGSTVTSYCVIFPAMFVSACRACSRHIFGPP